MEGPTIDSMCRCCASEGIFKDIKTSYQWMGEEEVYGDMLRECFDVKLASVEEGGICEVCITQLRNSVNFKKQVLQTEKKFKRQLDSGFFKRTEVKEEDDGNSSDDLDRGDDSEEDEDYVPDFEIPIKTESPEDSKSRKRGAKATTSRAKKSKSDPDYKSIAFRKLKIKRERESEEAEDIKPKIEDILCQVSTKPAETVKQIKIKPIPILPSTAKAIQVIPKPRNKGTCTPFTKIESSNSSIKIKPAQGQPEQLETEKQRYNIRTILVNSNATPIRHHNVGSGYYCCFCKESFPAPADLKAHTINQHDDITKQQFMKNVYLFSYIVKLDITELSCDICYKPLDRVDQLFNHLNNEHGKGLHLGIKDYYACFKFNGDEMKCCICTVEYHSFKALQEHMNKHSTNVICDDCGASYINHRQLSMHSVIHSSGTFKCPSCDKVFKSNMYRKMHIRQAHTTLLIYKCQLCEDRFKTIGRKRKHLIETHGIVFADYECDACERTFKTRGAITLHKRKDHLMERSHRCTQCEQAFFTAALLRNHEITHTGQRDFKCEICSKTYSRRHGLREHMRSHTGDRRFKCTYCGLAFLQKCSLKGHLRSRHDAELQ